MGIEFEETIHIQPEVSGTPIDAYTKEETDTLLDNRIEPIEEVIPDDASSSNQLVTASDIDNFSNKSLSNLNAIGNNRLHALKGYEDNGELLTDAEGLADIKNYVRSTFDLDKFTVTGSPTITDDGIISGYSSSNIVQADYQIGYLYNKSWTVSTVFEYNTLTASTPLFAFANEISYGGVGVSVGNGVVFQSRFGESTTEVTAIRFTSFLTNATVGNRYRVTLDFNITTGVYTLSYQGLDDNLSDIGTYTPTTTDKQIRNIYLQNTGLIKAAGGVGWTGNALSIDLKQFSIIADNVEVFNGNQTGTDTYTIGGNTVTIPYTLSKTGSKIVDSQYRNEVKAVYEAQGYAPYYTLSNIDFTLPMGEIYGMIEKKADKEDIPDLTNYYNKTQTDALLDEKQDTLTPNSPLTIATYAKSNLNGLAYTLDATGVYTENSSSITTTISAGSLGGVNHNPINAYCRGALPSTLNAEAFWSMGYIDIPFELNKTYLVNNGSTSYSYTRLYLGKATPEGDFIPLYVNTRDGGSSPRMYLSNSDTVQYVGVTGGTNIIRLNNSYTQFTGSRSNVASAMVGCTALQVIEEPNGSISIYELFGNNDGRYSITFSDTASIQRIKEANVVRIDVATQGTSVSNPIPVAHTGRYSYTTPLTGGTTFEDLGENEFDISGVETFNYLDLHVGAGLAIQNGNLVNTSIFIPMTSTEYGSITPDSSTLYILTDTGAIYLGTTLIAQKNA